MALRGFTLPAGLTQHGHLQQQSGASEERRLLERRLDTKRDASSKTDTIRFYTLIHFLWTFPP